MELELELVLVLVFRRSPLILLTLVPPPCANERVPFPLWRPRARSEPCSRPRLLLPVLSCSSRSVFLPFTYLTSPPFPEANNDNLHIIVIIYTGAKVSIHAYGIGFSGLTYEIQTPEVANLRMPIHGKVR